MSYYSISSTHRKDDQLQSRYTSKNQPYNARQQFAQTTRTNSIQKQTALMQQQQISDLQRKIDIILMHNQKLQSQKERYRLMYEEIQCQNSSRDHQSKTARFITQENQIIISKLRKQLEMNSKTYQRRLNQSYESRQILKEQIDTISKIIEQLNQQNKDLKLSIKQQSIKIQSSTYELKQEFIRQQAQLQNKLRDQFLIRQIQLKNQKKEVMEVYENQIADLKRKFQQQKNEIQKAHEDLFRKFVQQTEREKQQIRKQMRNQFEKERLWLEGNHRNQMKKQQDKANQFIKTSLQNVQSNDQQIKKQYQDEINNLKQSLEARKKLIDTLLKQQNQIIQSQHFQNISGQNQAKSKNQPINSHQISWFQQLVSLKHQMKHVTNQFLQQSQLLKLKLTQRFEIDIRELKKIYQDKIQLLVLHNQRVEQQNTRLREIYENLLEVQIQAKKDNQLQKGKLKNLIRKLRVELHGIQEQFKLNIEGVKDQNNTFSMTMMKSMIQVKQKANFYSQQNRKLRKQYEEHENQCNQSIKQSQEKVAYYEQKYSSLKDRLNVVINDYKQKIEIIQIQSQQRQHCLRQNLNKQHQMIHEIVEGLRRDVQNLTNQNHKLKKKCHDIQCTFKEKDQDISIYKSKVDQLEADIERLKMDLQMAGVNDKDKADTINQWKNHYETIVRQLQEQKSILNEKVLQKDDQLNGLVKKYRLLQFELQKVVKALQKRSNLEKKVLELGTDANLVKNLAEVFGNNSQVKRSIRIQSQE